MTTVKLKQYNTVMKNTTDNLLQLSSTILPIVSYFGKTEQKTGWEHSGRTAKTNIMVMVLNGSAFFKVSGKEYLIAKGGIFFVVNGEYYEVYTPDFCEYYFIHFSTDLKIADSPVTSKQIFVRSPFAIPPPPEFITLARAPVIPEELSAELVTIFAKISAQKQQHGQNLALSVSSLFLTALIKVSNNSDNDKHVPSKVRAMLDYINANVMKNITLNSLCEHFSLSKQYVCRLFKQHLKSSVNDVIYSHKMASAGEYLDFSALNVTQIAEKLGFDNIYYFSRKFKEFYGTSPTEYRKRR